MSSKQEKPCPLCKEESFEWGELRSQGSVVYAKEQSGWLKKQFASGDKLKARRCLSCDNVQIFLN